MRRRRWIDITRGNSSVEQYNRRVVAIMDIMHHKAGYTEIASIDKSGVAHIPVPTAVREREPSFPATLSFASSKIHNSRELHGTRALLLWMDRDYFKPQQIMAAYESPKTDHDALARKGIDNHWDYSLQSLKEDCQPFVNSLVTQIYLDSNCTIKLPLHVECFQASGTETANNPSLGILLMTTPEFQEVLIHEVYDLLHEPRKTFQYYPEPSIHRNRDSGRS